MSQNFIASLLKALRNLAVGSFWLGWWVFGLGVWSWYLLHWWSGDRLLWMRYLSYFVPWLLVGLIPGLAAAGLARRKWLALMLTVPVMFIVLTYASLFLPSSDAPLAVGTPFKIMSHNLWGDNLDVTAITTVIAQEQPDILLLQELNPSITPILLDELAKLYPELHFDVVRQPGYGFPSNQAIISHYPITPVAVEAEKGRTQKVIINLPNGPIDVWNVHPVPPASSWSQLHDRQVIGLVKDISAIKRGLIVAGDFNASDQSASYWLVNRYLRNAHWQAGWGFGFTSPARPHKKGVGVATGPLFRVDHIFYSHHFFVHSARTLTNAGGSDHLPVIAELSLVE